MSEDENHPVSSSDDSHGINEKQLNLFLENQKAELEIRSQEVDLRRQELDHSFTYSKSALEAQERDLASQREHSGKQLSTKLRAALIGTVALFAFLGYSAYIDQMALALELLKLAGVFVGGGGLGYSYGSSRARRQQDSD